MSRTCSNPSQTLLSADESVWTNYLYLSGEKLDDVVPSVIQF